MECPKCRYSKSQVIDSRLDKDGISIRRRRRCLSCAHRFTTYEATEDRLLPILLQRKAGHGATLPRFRRTLSWLSTTTNTMSREVGRLTLKVTELEKAHSARKPTPNPSPGKRPQTKAGVKKALSRKATEQSATAVVLKVIRRHKKGIDCPKLKAITGFDDKKIRNILYLAIKSGTIKRRSRGVYISA